MSDTNISAAPRLPVWLFERTSVFLSMTESDASEIEVLEYAALLARLGISRNFLFVHVVTPQHRSPDRPLALIEERLADAVRSRFDALEVKIDLSCHVREGVRVDSLIEFVDEHSSDLILLGHRKNRSGRRSLACRLAMIAPAAVWMVPEGSPRRITSILAPVDFSQHSAEALTIATDLAQQIGLNRCDVLHVFFDPSTIRYDEHLDEVRGREHQRLAEFLETVNTHGISIESIFDESNNVAGAILRVANRRGADLLVMNTRGRSQAAAILLGSATLQTMIECQIPILVVKNHGAHMTVLQALRDSRLWQPSSPKTN